MKTSTDTTITKHKNAKAMMIASMAIFGTLGIFTRNIAVTSGELALYRAVLAISLIAVYLVCTKQNINLRASKKNWFSYYFPEQQSESTGSCFLKPISTPPFQPRL